MGLLKEFREFAIRGNAVDMAVGIVIGAAFGKIVSSLVNDIIMPPIGMLLGGVDFGDLAITLKHGNEVFPPVTINYGIFLNTVLDFAIIAFTIFMVIKGMNALQKKKGKAPTSKKCSECLMEIPVDAKRCGHCTSAVGG